MTDLTAYYPLLKQVHVTTVTVTICLFVLRWYWVLYESPQRLRRWVKILPHVNDTLLLASGLSMAVLLQQYPLVNGWLTAKLCALLGYIVFGSIALKRGPTRGYKILGGWIALVCFGYLVSVAFSRDPMPWLSGLWRV